MPLPDEVPPMKEITADAFYEGLKALLVMAPEKRATVLRGGRTSNLIVILCSLVERVGEAPESASALAPLINALGTEIDARIPPRG